MCCTWNCTSVAHVYVHTYVRIWNLCKVLQLRSFPDHSSQVSAVLHFGSQHATTKAARGTYVCYVLMFRVTCVGGSKKFERFIGHNSYRVLLDHAVRSIKHSTAQTIPSCTRRDKTFQFSLHVEGLDLYLRCLATRTLWQTAWILESMVPCAMITPASCLSSSLSL